VVDGDGEVGTRLRRVGELVREMSRVPGELDLAVCKARDHRNVLERHRWGARVQPPGSPQALPLGPSQPGRRCVARAAARGVTAARVVHRRVSYPPFPPDPPSTATPTVRISDSAIAGPGLPGPARHLHRRHLHRRRSPLTWHYGRQADRLAPTASAGRTPTPYSQRRPVGRFGWRCSALVLGRWSSGVAGVGTGPLRPGVARRATPRVT